VLSEKIARLSVTVASGGANVDMEVTAAAKAQFWPLARATKQWWLPPD